MGLLASLGRVAYEIIANDKTGDGSKSAEKNLMAVGVAFTGVGIASKLMVDDVTTSFRSFDEAMTAVKALGVLSEEEFNRAKDAALDMSKQYPISATEVSDAMYSMISVGYDFDTMMQTMPEAIQLAVGGNMDLKDAIDTVINVFGAYGEGTYTAADVTNVLSKAVGVGKWELADFTSEIMRNIGSAANLGISFEELAAANVLLQNRFTSAEVAGTAMNAMLSRLVNPSVIQKLEEMGVHVKDNEGNFVGLDSVLDQLSDALNEAGGDVDRMSILQEIFGQDGVKAAIALLDEKDKLKDLTGEMNNAEQKTQAFNTVMESTSTQLDIANNKTEAAKIAFGEAMAPAMVLVADATGGVADIISSLPDPLQSVAGLAIYAAQGFAVLGPALMGLAALKSLGLGATIAGIGTSLATSATSIGTFVLAAGPLLPILVGLALGLAAVYAMNELGVFDAIYEFGGDVGGIVSGAGANFMDWLQGIQKESPKTGKSLDQIANSTDNLGNSIDGTAKKINNSGLVDGLNKSLEEANTETKTNTNEISGTLDNWTIDLSGVFGGISDTCRKFGELDVREIIFNTGKGITGLISVIYSGVKHFPETLKGWGVSVAQSVSTLPGAFSEFAKGSVNAVSNLPETIGGVVAGVGEALSNLPTSLDETREYFENVDLGGAASFAIDGLVGVLGGAKGILDPIVGAISEMMSIFWQGLLAGVSDELRTDLTNTFSTISEAFSALGGNVQTAFTNLFTGISDFIVGLAQGFIAAGYNIIMYIVQGMQSAAGAIASTIGNIFNIIGQFIPHSPAETGPLSQLPNFGAYFVDPLLATVPAVQAASLQVAEAAAAPVAQPASVSCGTSIGYQDNSAPIDIGSINASSDYSITDIMAEIATMQAQRRTQRGYTT
jgi:TP901 family phage tail tape measure protein